MFKVCILQLYNVWDVCGQESDILPIYAENSLKGNNRRITNVVVKRTRIKTLFILFDNVADLKCYFIISNVSEQLCVVNLTTILSRPRRVLNINKIERKKSSLQSRNICFVKKTIMQVLLSRKYNEICFNRRMNKTESYINRPIHPNVGNLCQ
jgi:hypothetical protein